MKNAKYNQPENLRIKSETISMNIKHIHGLGSARSSKKLVFTEEFQACNVHAHVMSNTATFSETPIKSPVQPHSPSGSRSSQACGSMCFVICILLLIGAKWGLMGLYLPDEQVRPKPSGVCGVVRPGGVRRSGLGPSHPGPAPLI